jgi:hypothetical protein
LHKVLGKRRIHGDSLTYNLDVVPDAIKALLRLQGILDPADREVALVQKEISVDQANFAGGPR